MPKLPRVTSTEALRALRRAGWEIEEGTMRRFTVMLYPEPEEGGYSVIVPLLPGCVTQGDTLDEALANAREAIALHVRGLERDDDYIPEEEVPPVVATVELPIEEKAGVSR